MTRSDRTPRQRLDPAERRESILAAAGHVFATQPYETASIAAVAAASSGSEALVYKYFGGKADLYAHALRRAVDDLAERRAAALAALPDGVPVRDRVRVITLAHLDEVAGNPHGWASPVRRPSGEPEAAENVRNVARRADVELLRGLLSPSATVRHDYALTAWWGYLDAAAHAWAERGCPADERWPLVDAALGALEGALGDWAA